MTIDVQAILTRSFEILKENAALLVGLTAAGMFIGIFVTIIGVVAQSIFMLLVGSLGEDLALGLGVLSLLFCVLISLVVYLYLGLALIKISLRLIRGEATTFQDGMIELPVFLQGLLSRLLMSLLVGVGMVFCFVPGIILSFGLIFTMYLTVDQKMGAVDALKKSWEMTDGAKMNIFIWALVCGALGFVGQMACFVGNFAAIPMIVLGTCILYEQMRGA